MKIQVSKETAQRITSDGNIRYWDPSYYVDLDKFLNIDAFNYDILEPKQFVGNPINMETDFENMVIPEFPEFDNIDSQTIDTNISLDELERIQIPEYDYSDYIGLQGGPMRNNRNTTRNNRNTANPY